MIYWLIASCAVGSLARREADSRAEGRTALGFRSSLTPFPWPLLCLALLLIAPALLVRNQMHKTYLNSELIEAISQRSYTDALELIRQGADGTARQGQDEDFRKTLSLLLYRLTHPSSKARLSADKPDALAVLYNTELEGRPDFTRYPQANPVCENLALTLLNSGSSQDSEPLGGSSFTM